MVSIKNSIAFIAVPLGKCSFHQYKLYLGIGIIVYTPDKAYPLIGLSRLSQFLRTTLR